MTTADLSSLLYHVAIGLYVAAMCGYAYGMANALDRGDRAVTGARARAAGLTLASLGLASHAGHLVTRSMAAGGRVPWGTMFEYSSVLAFVVAASGVLLFHLRFKRPEITTFLLLGAVLWMGVALATFGEAAPLQPILNSSWLVIHVFAMMVSFAILTISFVTNGLYLLRERAESRVAPRPAVSTVGAQQDVAFADDELLAPGNGTASPEGYVEGGVDGTSLLARSEDARRELRQAVSPLPGALVMAGMGLVLAALFDQVLLFPAYAIAGAASAYAVWWSVPYLPDSATLDSLTYRVSAFAFPILTFGIISGAVWAEQSWGRYWGWDPKETSAFLTWVAYASYLHARATRGVRGRNAAYVLFAAYGVLIFTFYVVNLVVVGLHSYAAV